MTLLLVHIRNGPCTARHALSDIALAHSILTWFIPQLTAAIFTWVSLGKPGIPECSFSVQFQVIDDTARLDAVPSLVLVSS
jgi:hypothetical protein